MLDAVLDLGQAFCGYIDTTLKSFSDTYL
jgi:hypothetical protein